MSSPHNYLSRRFSLIRFTLTATCRGCDIQFWRTPDERPCAQEFDREYSPGDLEPSEEWIAPLLEPVRLAYLTKPFVLQICLPSLPLHKDAAVALLAGMHPTLGGTWKEIVVRKHSRSVEVYSVFSHGRRFLRSLEYSSDCRRSLRDMQPSLEDRRNRWPAWERHGAGHPYADSWGSPLSCIISRGFENDSNLSGGRETYVPDRLLHGLLPQALLDAYTFWQSQADDLLGYPKTPASSMYMISIELRKEARVAATMAPGVSASVHRLSKARLETAHSYRMQLIRVVSDFFAANPLLLPSEQGPVVSYSSSRRLLRLVEEWVLDGGVAIGAAAAELRAVLAGYASSQPAEAIADLAPIIAAADDRLSEVHTRRAPPAPALALDQAELSLVQISFSDKQTCKFGSLLDTFSRLENASYILCWTYRHAEKVCRSVTADLIELPRLKMSFHERIDDSGERRIYSLDHNNLFVSNSRSELTQNMMRGMPHALLLSTLNGELQILVPVLNPVRPRLGDCPFTTELVLQRTSIDPHWAWLESLEARYYLYSVHISLSFVMSPTLASSLYLLLLRFLHRYRTTLSSTLSYLS